jgi:hypothetical protein
VSFQKQYQVRQSLLPRFTCQLKIAHHSLHDDALGRGVNTTSQQKRAQLPPATPPPDTTNVSSTRHAHCTTRPFDRHSPFEVTRGPSGRSAGGGRCESATSAGERARCGSEGAGRADGSSCSPRAPMDGGTPGMQRSRSVPNMAVSSVGGGAVPTTRGMAPWRHGTVRQLGARAGRASGWAPSVGPPTSTQGSALNRPREAWHHGGMAPPANSELARDALVDARRRSVRQRALGGRR